MGYIVVAKSLKNQIYFTDKQKLGIILLNEKIKYLKTKV